jgi:hypothetical protein
VTEPFVPKPPPPVRLTFGPGTEAIRACSVCGKPMADREGTVEYGVGGEVRFVHIECPTSA